MIVIVLSAAPAGLRGALTRWLLEVSAGVYVGHLSARVREQVWELISESIGNGRALLVYSTRSEQHFAVRSLGHEWTPVDVEGLTAMRSSYESRDTGPKIPGAVRAPNEAWSIAARRRRFRNSAERALGKRREE